MKDIIAVVHQPSCSNVFHVLDGQRIRVFQGSFDRAVGFAVGYQMGSMQDLGDTPDPIQSFSCAKGDAREMEWEQA